MGPVVAHPVATQIMQASMLFFCPFSPAILCTHSRRWDTSIEPAMVDGCHYRWAVKSPACPNCMHTVCNSTYFLRVATVGTRTAATLTKYLLCCCTQYAVCTTGKNKKFVIWKAAHTPQWRSALFPVPKRWES